MSEDDVTQVAGELAGDAAKAGLDAAGAPPLIGDLAEAAVKLAVAVVGHDRVQAILDAEYSAAEAAADAAADVLEDQKFGDPTTAKASPQAKRKAKRGG